MGLFDKIKNVLFEEEEIEIPVAPKEELPKEEKKEKASHWNKEKKEQEKTLFTKEAVFEPETEEIKFEKPEEVITPPVEETKEIEILERDVFASKQTFEFPVFDETDFSDTDRLTRSSNNVLEYEKKEKKKKLDFGKYETAPKNDGAKVFTPSPVISPVYGVLEASTAKRENVIYKTEDNSPKKKIDIDAISIQKSKQKTLEEVIESQMEDTSEYEEIKPTKSIDDLLMDTSDEKITVGDLEATMEQEILVEDEIFEDTDEITVDEPSKREQDLEKTLNILNEIESELETNKKNEKEKLENDTLESDLFSLIDSMYEDREDGE